MELEFTLLINSVMTLVVYRKGILNMNMSMSIKVAALGWAISVEGGLPTPSNVVMVSGK